MKLLLVLALLLLAWEAGAVEPLTIVPSEGDRFQYTLTGALKIDRASWDAMLKDYPEAKLRVMLVDEPRHVPLSVLQAGEDQPNCLAQMEQAMRAMEDLLASGAGRLYAFRDTKLTINMPHEWHAAKRDCWRTP